MASGVRLVLDFDGLPSRCCTRLGDAAHEVDIRHPRPDNLGSPQADEGAEQAPGWAAPQRAFIRAPYCGLPADLRYNDAQGDCGLLVTDVFGGALIRLKISFIAGIVLSAPFWLFQLWRFLTPGLKGNEKRYGVLFVAASSTLFAVGAALAYLSLAAGLRLLLELAGDGVVVALTAEDYIGFVISLSLLLAFGVSFELPLIAVVLNLVGVLSHAALSQARRWLVFLTILFAAFVTPTQDPFTMLAMAGPMVVLFEGAIQIARLVDRRRARRAAIESFHDVGDDQASPLEASPSPLDVSPSPLNHVRSQ